MSGTLWHPEYVERGLGDTPLPCHAIYPVRCRFRLWLIYDPPLVIMFTLCRVYFACFSCYTTSGRLHSMKMIYELQQNEIFTLKNTIIINYCLSWKGPRGVGPAVTSGSLDLTALQGGWVWHKCDSWQKTIWLLSLNSLEWFQMAWNEKGKRRHRKQIQDSIEESFRFIKYHLSWWNVQTKPLDSMGVRSNQAAKQA